MSIPFVEQRLAAAERQGAAVERGERFAQVSSYASQGVGFLLLRAASGTPVTLAIFAAAYGGAKLGAWIAEEFEVAKHLADGLEFVGLRRIGQYGPEGPNPATVGDPIAHSYALLGFLGAVLLGVAAAAFVVVTCGAGAAALVGAAAAAGVTGGFSGVALVGALSQFGAQAGPIVSGSPNVFIGGRQAARMTDTALCTKHAPPAPMIVQGSATIFINHLPLARVGHKLVCGAVIDGGVTSVHVDETTQACTVTASEIPVELRVAVDWIAVVLLAKAVSQPKTLNLGAGSNLMKGAVNVDIKGGPGVIAADAANLPFKTGAFTEVHAINPFGFNPVSAETARVLKPGGLLSVSGTKYNKFAQPVSPEVARAAGFEIIETTPLKKVHNFGVQQTSAGQQLKTSSSTTTVYRKLP